MQNMTFGNTVFALCEAWKRGDISKSERDIKIREIAKQFGETPAEVNYWFWCYLQ